MNRAFLVAAVGLLILLTPLTQALPHESRSRALTGANRLLDVQFDDGSFPWIVGQSGKYQNVQGITAVGLLSAYQLSLDPKYLGNETAGATGNRNWIVNYMDTNPTAFVSSGNVFFLAEYAMLTGDAVAMDTAQDAMVRAIDRYGSPEALVDGILQARATTYGNLGVWDVALFVRAASETGWEEVADDMIAHLLATTIVDLFDNTTNYFELGLSGLLFALAEADYVQHQDTITAARDALLATQCENKSFPTTWQGVVYCDDVQSTAYAVIGLASVLEGPQVTNGPCSFIISQQAPNHGWDVDGYEYAEIDAEAVVALALCAAPLNTGVGSYADAVRDALL